MSPSRTLGCLLCLGVAIALPSHGASGNVQIPILAHLYHAPCLFECFPRMGRAKLHVVTSPPLPKKNPEKWRYAPWKHAYLHLAGTQRITVEKFAGAGLQHGRQLLQWNGSAPYIYVKCK